MSMKLKTFAAALIAGGLMMAMPGAAQAQWRGGWHRGGWGPGWGGYYGYGFGPGWGYPPPYSYGPRVYEPSPECGWVRTRFRRGGRLVYGRVWRCW